MAEQLQFKPAVRKQVFARVALIGPSGSGKSYSALRLAKGMGDRVAMINTEGDRGQLYANEFDYCQLDLEPPFAPERFIEAINAAVQASFDVVIIDSASHEWSGSGGLLEAKDKAPDRNSFTAWNALTPRHDAFVAAMTASPVHVIACLRGKDQYVLEKNERGKEAPKKVGLGPEQRKGIEYEFMLSLLLDQRNHCAIVAKDNTNMFGDTFCDMLTEAHGAALRTWSENGATPAAPAAPAAPPVSYPTDVCPIGKVAGKAWSLLDDATLCKIWQYVSDGDGAANPAMTAGHKQALAQELDRRQPEPDEPPPANDNDEAEGVAPDA